MVKNSLKGFLWLCFELLILVYMLEVLGYISIFSNLEHMGSIYDLYSGYVVFAGCCLVWFDSKVDSYLDGEFISDSLKLNMFDIAESRLRGNLFSFLNKLVDFPIMIGFFLMGHYLSFAGVILCSVFNTSDAQCKKIIEKYNKEG